MQHYCFQALPASALHLWSQPFLAACLFTQHTVKARGMTRICTDADSPCQGATFHTLSPLPAWTCRLPASWHARAGLWRGTWGAARPAAFRRHAWAVAVPITQCRCKPADTLPCVGKHAWHGLLSPCQQVYAWNRFDADLDGIHVQPRQDMGLQGSRASPDQRAPCHEDLEAAGPPAPQARPSDRRQPCSHSSVWMPAT